MKVMYIVPRYHTNMVPTINGWVRNKHEVAVVTHTKGRIEDYSAIQPIVAGYSLAYKLFLSFYVNVIARKNPIAKDISLKIGVPSKRVIRKILREYKPDLVILREKSLYSIVCNRECQKLAIKTIMYNQSPVWADSSFFKDDLSHKVVNMLTPSKRITPVNQIGYGIEGKVKGDDAIFAPFVMDLGITPGEKAHYAGGVINILEIGKYERRKNHLMMVDVFEKLVKAQKNVKLTIVGEKSSKFHEEYYQNLIEYIRKKRSINGEKLENLITLKFNLNRQQIVDEYSKADLFVLPSTGEPAAISCIEAMANSVPAICSTGNGTADYIIPGETGDIFKDKDADDLYEKIDEMICDKSKLICMGEKAYERVRSYCSFEKYYEAIKSTGVMD